MEFGCFLGAPHPLQSLFRCPSDSILIIILACYPLHAFIYTNSLRSPLLSCLGFCLGTKPDTQTSFGFGFGRKTACCVASATASRRFVGTAQKNPRAENPNTSPSPNRRFGWEGRYNLSNVVQVREQLGNSGSAGNSGKRREQTSRVPKQAKPTDGRKKRYPYREPNY